MPTTKVHIPSVALLVSRSMRGFTEMYLESGKYDTNGAVERGAFVIADAEKNRGLSEADASEMENELIRYGHERIVTGIQESISEGLAIYSYERFEYALCFHLMMRDIEETGKATTRYGVLPTFDILDSEELAYYMAGDVVHLITDTLDTVAGLPRRNASAGAWGKMTRTYAYAIGNVFGELMTVTERKIIVPDNMEALAAEARERFSIEQALMHVIEGGVMPEDLFA